MHIQKTVENTLAAPGPAGKVERQHNQTCCESSATVKTVRSPQASKERRHVPPKLFTARDSSHGAQVQCACMTMTPALWYCHQCLPIAVVKTTDQSTTSSAVYGSHGGNVSGMHLTVDHNSNVSSSVAQHTRATFRKVPLMRDTTCSGGSTCMYTAVRRRQLQLQLQ